MCLHISRKKVSALKTFVFKPSLSLSQMSHFTFSAIIPKKKVLPALLHVIHCLENLVLNFTPAKSQNTAGLWAAEKQCSMSNPLYLPPPSCFFFAFYFRLSKSLKIELAGGWWQLWLHSQFSIFLLKTMEIDSSANNYHSLPLPHSLMYHQRHPTTFIIHIKGWSWLAPWPRLTYLAPSSFNSCPVLDWSSQPAILCDQSLINPRAPPNNFFFRLIMRNWIWQGGSEQKWVESFWTKPKMGKIKHRTKNIPQKVKQITNKLQSTFTATSI